MRIQIIAIVVLIIAFALLVGQIKKKKLDIKYSLAWMLLDIVLIILAAFPKLIVWISKGLGIETPSNMVFFCGFIFSLIIIYVLTVAISKMSDNIRCLTQKIALLEKEVKEKEEENC